MITGTYAAVTRDTGTWMGPVRVVRLNIFGTVYRRRHSVIDVQLTGVAGSHRTHPQVWRATPRLFWTLFALVGLLIAGVLVVIISFLPARAPLANTGDYTIVREAVWARLNGTVEDALIEVAPGTTARSSNLRGFALKGSTYYYYLEGRPSFDPLNRGLVGRDEIEVVLRDDGGPAPLVIYRLLSRR
jgi:hypothetical protein